MNTLVSYMVTNPQNKIDECAMFTIDDVSNKFVLSDVIVPGGKYIFSFWARSEADGNLICRHNNYPTSSKWIKHVVPFEPTETSLLISFSVAGTYYIYHPKLESGDKVTDWSPAPEDADDKINANAETLSGVNEQLGTMSGTVTQLQIDVGGMLSRVETLKGQYDDISGEYELLRSQYSEVKQTAKDLVIGFGEIDKNGVSQVVTETGFTFNNEGMTVDSNDSDTKTQITPDGMTVYSKNVNETPVLEATSEGVQATDLRANTFLIIGGRSRFENYESNGKARTACFWIGG